MQALKYFKYSIKLARINADAIVTHPHAMPESVNPTMKRFPQARAAPNCNSVLLNRIVNSILSMVTTIIAASHINNIPCGITFFRMKKMISEFRRVATSPNGTRA